jgi:hypothetical protein
MLDIGLNFGVLTPAQSSAIAIADIIARVVVFKTEGRNAGIHRRWVT